MVVTFWNVPVGAWFVFIDESLGKDTWRKVRKNEDGADAINGSGEVNDCIHFDHLCRIVGEEHG